MGLLLRALWWRRGLSLATLIVAAITIGAGSLGPMYARAADESALRDLLSSPGVDASLHYTFTVELDTMADLANAEGRGPRPGSITGYPTAVGSVLLSTQAGTPAQALVGNRGPRTQAVYRDGLCAHLVMVQGRCPTRAGEVVVSERTLQGGYYGWRLGQPLRLSGVAHDVQAPDGSTVAAPTTVTVVGSYVLADSQDPYWFGRNYFNAHPGSGDGPDTVDDIFFDRAQLDQLSRPSTVTVQLDYPIQAERVRLADVSRIKAQLAELTAFGSPGSAPDDHFSTGAPVVLANAVQQTRLVDVATLLVSLQLAVLAWLVLFQVVADAVEAKGPEIALAKLRGLRPAGTVRFGLAEPLLLVLLATPIGVLGGWLSVRLLASTVLRPGTPVAFTRATAIAVLLSLAGSAIAALAAARRTLRRPVLEQWRRTPGHHPSRWMLALDLVLAAGAIAGLVVLQTTRHGGTPRAATLLAPPLLVFAVALLGIRLVPVVLRPVLPVTRGTDRIGLFLAARQVSRRPAGLRLAALLAVAVGLATFAIAGEGVAARNQQARARVETGAPTVAAVQFQPLHDPVAATRTADPTGSWAMATASWLPDGGGSVTGEVLAVDTGRLAATGYSGDTDRSTRQLADRLVPASIPPPLTIKTTAVRLSLTASNLTPGAAPTVLVNLRRPGQRYLDVRAGALRAGSHTYQATVPCQSGCTLAGITWDRPIDTFEPLSGRVLVSRIEVSDGGGWHELAAGLTAGGDWRQATQAGNAGDQLTVTGAGLTDDYHSEAGGSAGLAHADSPRPLRAVASAHGVAPSLSAPGVISAGPQQMLDAGNAVADYVVTDTVRVLPVVQDAGMLVDLSAIRAQLPGFDTEASWSIWLGPAAPPDALARLRAAGLVLDPPRYEHTRQTELARQGPALALRLLVVCAIAGSILAVGGTAIAIAATGRRRTFELASLRVLGIRPRALLRASVFEQLLLLGAALLLGVPAGYLAARLVLPTIPQFADTTPVRLHYSPALLGVGSFALAFCLLLAATALVAGQLLMRAAAPARLREAE